MKMFPMGDEFFHVGRQTDVMKLMDTLSNFAKMLEKQSVFYLRMLRILPCDPCK
jgi:hypothetical protein